MLEEQIHSLISRIEKCVHGDRFETQLAEVPVKVVVYVFWEEDLEATTLYEIDFNKDSMSQQEVALFDFLMQSYELEVCPIFDDQHINELPSFAETKVKIEEFHKEVRSILIELTNLSLRHPDVFDSIKSIIPKTNTDEN